MGRVIVRGALSKELIGRVIRRRWNEIRWRYETGLSRNPALEGKVAAGAASR